MWAEYTNHLYVYWAIIYQDYVPTKMVKHLKKWLVKYLDALHFSISQFYQNRENHEKD